MRRFGSRLLWRIFLYGVVLLVLAGGASFVVGSYLITPVVEGPARPSTAWIAWHLLEIVDDRSRVEHELADLKRRARVEMTLFDARGGVLASNATRVPEALSAPRVSDLAQQTSEFSGGMGVVALRGSNGQVLRYARVSYPVPELPIGSAAAQLIAALAVLAVLSIPLARSLTAPLERLRRLARAFGAGDLSARSGLESRDEIGDLGRSLDEMADRVVSLRRSEKELLANVSHELRTPLARIRMALELAREGDTERAAGYFADIEEDLEELEHLLDDVMAAARLDISRGSSADALPPLRRRKLDARELIEAASARFEKRVPERRLEPRVAPDAPRVEADPGLLRRVLDNLLDNAAKFSEPGSPIELEAARGDGGELVVEVRDLGIGIDEGELERIFEPFYRTDRSRARATGGVGLGLALARRIVEGHGGRIVALRGREQGSCFRVTVPSA